MFSRDLSLKKTSKGNIFRVVVWSWSWCPPFLYVLSSSPASQGWIFWTIFLFPMELMVDHLFRRIQFGLIMSVAGSSFVVLVMVSPTCSYFYPVLVLDVNDGKFPA